MDDARLAAADDDDDAALVEREARRLIETYGRGAARLAREEAEIAAELRDSVSAAAWHDIANAIHRLFVLLVALIAGSFELLAPL